MCLRYLRYLGKVYCNNINDYFITQEECSEALAKMLVGWAEELDCESGFVAKGDARCMSYGKMEKLMAGTAVPANA